jgi:hypothetical protein
MPIMPFAALEKIYETSAPTCSPSDVFHRVKGCAPTLAPTAVPTMSPTTVFEGMRARANAG